MAYDEGTLLVVDVRCLEKPTVASSAKAQGWAVLPVFVDKVVDSGLHQLPLFQGSPEYETLAQLAKAASKSVADWHQAVSGVMNRRGVGVVESASVCVTLLDAQRFGELDRGEKLPPIATPDRVRLPAGVIETYLKEAPTSKPLSSLVGKVRATKGSAENTSPTKGGGGLFGGGMGVNPLGQLGGGDKKPPLLSQEELQIEMVLAFKQALGITG